MNNMIKAGKTFKDLKFVIAQTKYLIQSCKMQPSLGGLDEVIETLEEYDQEHYLLERDINDTLETLRSSLDAMKELQAAFNFLSDLRTKAVVNVRNEIAAC